jgi:signal transduction histidine kinase
MPARRSRPCAGLDTGWAMADGIAIDPQDDGAERSALASEAQLVRRVRLRLVLWSGISTLVVLLILAAALYAVVANTLSQASINQLQNRISPIVAALTGTQPSTSDPRGLQGFAFGAGNTLLFIFDAQGQPVQLGDRAINVPTGLPETTGLEGAKASPDGVDVRLATLQIANGTGVAATSVPIRILTREVVAHQDGNTYYLQVLQDRSTEVETLNALLRVLLVGGLLVVVVSIGFGTIYARRALVPIRESLESQRVALRRQREFAADASHELRTPLTVIRSSVEHLVRHPDRKIADEREAIDDIDAEVTSLAALVDDLLLLARSDSGAVALERMPVDLGDVAFEAASSLARTAEDRGVHVEVDPEPAMVEGDPVRLRQLVTILVDNAVRHSPRGCRVGVTVRAANRLATIDVTDQGNGVREEDMPHIFDRFWRAPGAPSGGTGLGLAIAQWIVTSHGGRIGVANRPEGGAVFRVELPCAMPPAGAMDDPAGPPPEPAPPEPPGA